jgi:hypothetical protein
MHPTIHSLIRRLPLFLTALALVLLLTGCPGGSGGGY